ncbi:MAG: acyl-CoA dehydrogenase family protein, partial [Myxococcota bacterium]
PLGRAVVDGDDFVVTGRWPWASGSANCRWLAGGCMIMQGNEVRRRSDGAPDSRFILFPRADVELIDTWRASGMRGTGSGDMAVHEVRVPQTHAVSLTDDALNNAPLYKFPVFGLLAVGIASVALGNAKGALDALRTLATAKRPQFSRRSLAERSMVQAEFARASARWRAALALLDEVVDRCWASAQQEGPLSIEIRADLRLACTHATRESAEVATTAYELGGGTSVYSSHPLQRHFRDAHVATQHIMVSPPSYELTGRVLFGLDADTSML